MNFKTVLKLFEFGERFHKIIVNKSDRTLSINMKTKLMNPFWPNNKNHANLDFEEEKK